VERHPVSERSPKAQEKWDFHNSGKQELYDGPQEAEIQFQQVYVPTVQYFIPLTSLSGKEIQQITR
jgi:hypothetical protein